MSSRRSTPITMPIAPTGSFSLPSDAFTAVITMTIVTRPALGMPAAPTAASVAVATTTASSPKLSCTP